MKLLKWLYEFVFGPRKEFTPAALLSHPVREAQLSAQRSFDRFDQAMSFIVQQAQEDRIDPEPIGKQHAHH